MRISLHTLYYSETPLGVWTDCLFFKMPISLWLIWEKTLLKVMRSIQWVYENTFNQFSCQINNKSEQGLSSTVLHTKATPSFIPYLVQYGTKCQFPYGWSKRRPYSRWSVAFNKYIKKDIQHNLEKINLSPKNGPASTGLHRKAFVVFIPDNVQRARAISRIAPSWSRK